MQNFPILRRIYCQTDSWCGPKTAGVKIVKISLVQRKKYGSSTCVRFGIGSIRCTLQLCRKVQCLHWWRQHVNDAPNTLAVESMTLRIRGIA